MEVAGINDDEIWVLQKTESRGFGGKKRQNMAIIEEMREGEAEEDLDNYFEEEHEVSEESESETDGLRRRWAGEVKAGRGHSGGGVGSDLLQEGRSLLATALRTLLLMFVLWMFRSWGKQQDRAEAEQGSSVSPPEEEEFTDF